MKTKDEIRTLISEVPGFDSTVNLTFQYLAEGITNENYWLNINGCQYVLRINNPDSERLGLDRNAEIKIMSEVSSLNLSPEHIFYSQKSNFYFSKWIAGEVWRNHDLQKQINLNRLAQRLKQLHNLPSHAFPRMDLIKRLDLYRTMVQKRHGDLPSIEKRILSYTINRLGTMNHSLSACLCHNDLVVANILETTEQKICFLDWEYAAVNEPLFELAVICKGNQLSEENRLYFLQAYLGDATYQITEELEMWCWFYDYLSLLWGLVILPEDIQLPVNLIERLQQLYENRPLP